MRVDKIGSPLLPQREYNTKREWLLPVEILEGGWRFYDNGKDINGTCRVAAYLNQSIKPTGDSFCG